MLIKYAPLWKIRRLIDLWKAGIPVKQIAKEVELSETTVRKHGKRYEERKRSRAVYGVKP